jgi:hypothetical protein
MKAKISRGTGFRGLLDYVLDSGPRAKGDKQPEIVGGNLSGENASEMAREFSAVWRTRPDVAKPVWHCSLSLPSGEKLSQEKWGEVADAFMAKMGFSECHPYTAIRHRDTEFDHVHIIASRVGLDGSLWHGQWEAHEAIKISQELEKEFGLVQTEGYKGKKDRKTLTAKEINMAVRQGKEPPKQRLQNMIDEVITIKPTIVDLAKILENEGVEVQVKLYETGTVSGISFSLEGIKFKGSSLGKAYSWSGLMKRGVTYEQARDSEELKRFAASTTVARTADGVGGADKRYETEVGSFADGDSGGGEDSIRGSFGEGESVKNVDRRRGQNSEEREFHSEANIGKSESDGDGDSDIEKQVRGRGRGNDQGGVGDEKVYARDREDSKKWHDRSGREGEERDRGNEGKREQGDRREGGGGKEVASDDRVFGQTVGVVDNHVNGGSASGGIARSSDSSEIVVASMKTMAIKVKEEAAVKAAKKAQLQAEKEAIAKQKAEKEAKEMAEKKMRDDEENEQKLEAERLKFEEKTANVLGTIFTQKYEELNIPAWCEKQFNLWRSPKTAKVYLFHRDRKAEAPVAMDKDKVYFLKGDDESILLALVVARDRWPGQILKLSGSDAFKARAMSLAKEHQLGIEFALESKKAPEPERPRPRPRPRGMGR